VSSPEAALRRCWSGLAGDGHETIIAGILARHREPHRRYHTATHVMWVLHHVDVLIDAARAGNSLDSANDGVAGTRASPAGTRPIPVGRVDVGVVGVDVGVVRAAALFHDVIYDPLSSTNEHDSAVLAVRWLGEVGWDLPRLHRVAALIEATAGHITGQAGERADGDPSDRVETAVLLDADLAILGAAPAEYRAYVAGVRAEYGHVTGDGWRTGRATILRSFLDRPAIYATTTMHAAREVPARANLTTELTELEER
jgi:predicted metal-dependent HD superfamily phosphohydrolase